MPGYKLVLGTQLEKMLIQSSQCWQRHLLHTNMITHSDSAPHMPALITETEASENFANALSSKR